jgi:UDP-N-acetylmuramate dehydrogenase
MKQDLTDRLVSILGSENVRTNEPMKKHTTFKIGGPAEIFITPDEEEKLKRAIACIKKAGMPYYIMGNGSNLLVSDDGYPGVIVQLCEKYNQIIFAENVCTVQAGCLLSKLGMQAAARGLSGLEFATGIPGTVGGAVVMNAGAYGGEISQSIRFARLMDEQGNVLELDRDELKLGYRTSIAMERRLIVLSAQFTLDKSEPELVRKKIKELSEARRSKQPLEYPSAGSTFKRPQGYFAGQLIEQAGLKGYAVGDAQVSEKHSGFVINTGNATAKDVMALVMHIQKTVKDISGVTLEMEIRKLGNFN